MVPDTPDVESVLFDKGGVAEGLSKGQDGGRHELHLADGDQGLREEIEALGCDYVMRRSRVARWVPRRRRSPSCAAAPRPRSSA
jgi:hypothetical protein